MEYLYQDDGYTVKVTGYDFKVPSTRNRDSDFQMDEYWHICLKSKMALFSSNVDLKVKWKQINIIDGELHIEYREGRGFSKAGPISQDTYKTFLLEKALTEELE